MVRNLYSWPITSDDGFGQKLFLSHFKEDWTHRQDYPQFWSFHRFWCFEESNIPFHQRPKKKLAPSSKNRPWNNKTRQNFSSTHTANFLPYCILLYQHSFILRSYQSVNLAKSNSISSFLFSSKIKRYKPTKKRDSLEWKETPFLLVDSSHSRKEFCFCVIFLLLINI
jgi:hypothetical protein